MSRYFNHLRASLQRFSSWYSVFIFTILVVSLLFTPPGYCVQANLAWDPDTEQVAGYEVWYGPSSGHYTANLNVGNATTATLQNLSPAVYYITVTAYDSSGDQSSYSPELVIYPLTSSAGTGGSISPAGTFFQSQGGSQNFTITPASGYSVSEVTVDGVSVGAVASYPLTNITSAHTISAVFSPSPSYTVTPSAGSGGSLGPSTPQTVDYDGTVSFSVNPNTGFSISSVTGCNGTLKGNSYTTGPITGDCTVTATFAAITYTITPSATGSGSISPTGPVPVNCGCSKTLAVTPNKGYTAVMGGTCGGTLSGTTYTTKPITANCSVSANFVQSSYTIVSSSGTGGYMTPSGALQVGYGASQNISIIPNSGYKVADVGVDGVSIGAVAGYTFSNVTADHIISAEFKPCALAPVADAGPNRTVDEGASMTLNGLNSTDKGGPGISSYLWTQTAGEPATIVAPHSAKTNIEAPYQPGALDFQLTATDKNGLKSTANCIVNIASSNMPPTASAGPDQTVGGLTIVTLDGSQSFASQSCFITVYKWTQIDGPAVTISNPMSSQATFIAPQPLSGNMSASFMLTVTDNNGLESTDICYVNITWADPAPRAVAGITQTVNPGSTVSLNGSSSSACNGIASFRWKQTGGSAVKLSDPTSAIPSFTAPATVEYGNTLTFRLTVQDTAGLRSRATATVNVE
jgi:hypothetical protein